jgi:hypothetical protein
MLADRGLQTFSVKHQRANILDFTGHMVSMAITKLCQCSMKADGENLSMKKCGHVPIKLYS